ncbi:MAG: MBL fold metallo-hydrolase [Thermodesulfobacteriota bacterium]
MSIQITEQIYRIELPIPFPLGTTNIFFVDGRPRTLIDTGIKTEASFEALKKGLKEIGFSISYIERILITHGHIDHYGQAKRIASLSGASIYLHPKEYGKIRSIIHSLGFLKSILIKNGTPETLADQAIHYIEMAQKMADPLEDAFFLNDGDSVPFGSMTWKAIHCPGHSPGLLCFYWPERKILFTGDHLLKEITPNPFLNIPETGMPLNYPSLKEYLSSLKKVETLEPLLLLPGHGEEIRDPKGLIQNILNHHKKRMVEIVSSLREGSKTAFEVAMALFPNIPPFETFLGISEAVGHLAILKDEGKVRVIEKEGKDYYILEE